MIRYFLMLIVWMFAISIASAQDSQQQFHKVKKKETMYSISRMYGVTVEELVKANPEMAYPDYKLKKGSKIRIPLKRTGTEKAVQTTPPETDKKTSNVRTDVRNRAIRLGIMLPLHDRNGDGKRMVEYYRGVLMACDSLKKTGISVDVHAWNVPEDSNIEWVLAEKEAADCDIIIGPLYSAQVQALSDFVEKHNIMMVIPFSINSQAVFNNRHVFQVYQNPTEQNENTVRRFCDWFKDAHPVIVDCGDTTSTKGPFTSALRKSLEQRGVKYSITSLKSKDETFQKAFAKNKQNVVVLNSGRSPELIATFGKLSSVVASNPEVKISMFGYTEWLMYLEYQLDNFYRYDVYVPSPFYTNSMSTATERFRQLYRNNFHQDMMQALPRFALTGFDHAYFFLKGLHKYGAAFDGAAGRFGYPPIQTPLKFERAGDGGYLNRAYMFIHFKPEQKIDALNY